MTHIYYLMVLEINTNPMRLESRCQQGCVPLEALRETDSRALCSFWCCLHLPAHGPSSEHIAPATAFVIMWLLPEVKSPSPPSLKILGTAFTHNTWDIKCIGVFLTPVNPQQSGHHLGVFQPNLFLMLIELAQTLTVEGLSLKRCPHFRCQVPVLGLQGTHTSVQLG